MKISRQFARRFRLLKLLRASLAAGGVYSLALAAGLIAAPGLLDDLLGPAPPEAGGLVRLSALLLSMLAVLYLMAARDPRRYSGVILVAIGGRLAGATLFALWAAARPELSGPWVLAVAEGVLGVVHGGTWLPLRV